MYLFSRTRRLSPAHVRRGLAYSVEMAHKASQITGMDVSAWGEVWSPGLGNISWSTIVPDLLALEQGMDKLQVSDDFIAATEHGAEMFVEGLGEDRLFQIVHGEIDPNARPSYVTAVRARITNGKLADGLAFGVEIAQKAEAVTGLTTMFLAASTGGYGEVGWITGFDDVGQAQEENAKLMADPDWLKMLDAKTGIVYQNDAEQRMYRRLS